MNRKLYFLIPDKSHALTVVYDLTSQGINNDHIQILANKHVRLQGLPNAKHQLQNRTRHIENRLWKANLIIFGLALVCLLTLPFTHALNIWLLAPAGIMMTSFLTGLLFTRRPNVNLNEFRDALAHGEILLMVDVPQTRAADIEARVHHNHPETTAGGAGWESEVFVF